MTRASAELHGYDSSNFRKHTNPNPFQRLLLGRFHHAALDLLHVLPVRRVLDAGCGEGFALRAVLVSQGDLEVVGLDASPPALKVARRLNPGSRFAAGDLLRLPFPDRSFDLVVCMEVLEHLDDPRHGLAELCRVSARYLLLSVPNEPLFRGANFLRGKNVAALGNDPGHVNHWGAPGFVRFVRRQADVLTWRTSFPWTLVLCAVHR